MAATDNQMHPQPHHRQRTGQLDPQNSSADHRNRAPPICMQMALRFGLIDGMPKPFHILQRSDIKQIGQIRARYIQPAGG